MSTSSKVEGRSAPPIGGSPSRQPGLGRWLPLVPLLLSVLVGLVALVGREQGDPTCAEFYRAIRTVTVDTDEAATADRGGLFALWLPALAHVDLAAIGRYHPGLKAELDVVDRARPDLDRYAAALAGGTVDGLDPARARELLAALGRLTEVLVPVCE